MEIPIGNPAQNAASVAQVRIMDLEGEVYKLSAQLSTTHRLSANARQALRDQNAGLQRQLEEFQNDPERTAIEKENALLKKQVSKLTNDVNRLTKEAGNANRLFEQKQTQLQNAITELKTKVVAIEKQKADLSSSLNQARASLQVASEEMALLEIRNGDLDKELLTLSAEMQKMAAREAATQDQKKAGEEFLEKVKNEARTARACIDRLNHELEEEKRKNATLVESLQAGITDLRNQVEYSMAALEIERGGNAYLRTQIQSLTTQIQSLTAQLAEAKKCRTYRNDPYQAWFRVV